jgi:ATP-dependent DNA helicase RecQ
LSIIQNIDKRIPLDDIASSKGMEFDELLDELETFVYSGTKINLDYYINEVIDEDKIEDIRDYFMESDSDDLDDALDELGHYCTEEEIRLVRLNFLSELGN